jgi:cytoskeletal protein CcmA (bactofilin family)
LSKIFDELRSAESSRQNATIITAGLRIKGEVSGSEDLVVEGVVEGPIQLGNGTVMIGVKGKVIADISAREVIVHGEVKGNVTAQDRIEIRTNGSITGDVTTSRIIVEDGAILDASIETTSA